MGVPMIPAIVLIVCKTIVAGPPDANAKFTGYENRDWAYENSMMVCRREVVAVYDQALDGGERQQKDGTTVAVPPAAPPPFNQQRCMAAAIRVGVDWDISHRSSNYRVWRVACPTPIVDTRTGAVIGWKLPECGHRDTIVCDKDSVI